MQQGNDGEVNGRLRIQRGMQRVYACGDDAAQAGHIYFGDQTSHILRRTEGLCPESSSMPVLVL